MMHRFIIQSIQACEVFDSRGTPTVACQVVLQDGNSGFMQVPSGASTGQYEAFESRDGDAGRHRGKGVFKTIERIEQVIQPALVGHSIQSLSDCDRMLCELDGTKQKAKLGANAMLAVSGAFARAAANQVGLPLYEFIGRSALQIPVPLMNVLNGGCHAGNDLTIQEFMIVPFGFSSMQDALCASAEISRLLASMLKKTGDHLTRGDEGGFAPKFSESHQALDVISEAITQSGYRFNQVGIALDMAASEFASKQGYFLDKQGKKVLEPAQWVAHINGLCDAYPIVSVEDPAGDDDFTTWRLITEALGDKVQLVGDDVFVTQVDRLTQGIQSHVANAILIKPNQVGTITETFSAIECAQNNQYATVISHRSGETEDGLIADLAVASGASQIKAGPLRQSDRVAKYNRLLWIEKSLGSKAVFAKPNFKHYHATEIS